MRRKKIRRMATALAVVLGLTVISGGCGGDGKEPVGSTGGAAFKMASEWQINFTNNYYCGVSVMPITSFVVEGLYNRLDTVDYIVPILADGMPVHNEDGSTTVRIKEEARWHNGDPVTAQDVVAFYMLQHTTVTKYMRSIESVDEKTLKITWNENKPIANDVRDKLLALDYNCTIKYDEYQYYVDKGKELLLSCSDADAQDAASTPFGKSIDAETSAKMMANYTEFQKQEPSWYVATGPYKIKTYTATQFILEKNEDYWAADNIQFDTIECYQYSDVNLAYNALKNNEIYYLNGLPEEYTLNSMIAGNKDLVSIKMLDLTTVGINFNFEKEIWKDARVREAFQYIFNREEIKNISNPYAILDCTASNTMPLSERKKYLSEEHLGKLKQYDQNQEKAAQLLEEAGWSKVNGSWTDASGKTVELAMGGCNAHPGWNNAAVAAQAQLIEFGIDCQLKLTDMGTLFGVGMGNNSPYDCVVMWTELNGTISSPYGSFQNFADYYGYFTHLPRFAAGDIIGNGKALAGDINMEFPWIDGGIGPNGRDTVNYSEYVHSLYYLEEEECELVTASMVVGMSEYMYGVNFYQNITASTLNTGALDGVSLEEYWSKENNVTYVPEITSEDAIKAAQMNYYWSDATTFILGQVTPKKADEPR